MPIGTYFEYEFFSGSEVSTGDQTDFSIQFSDAGVNFTWSVSDTAGNNFIGHFPGTPPTTPSAPFFDGSLAGTVCGTTGSTPQDEFKLAFTDSNLTFSGDSADPIRLDFYTVAGLWTITFHTTGGSTQQFTRGTNATTGSGLYSAAFDTEVVITSGNYSHITFTTSSLNAAIFIDDLEMIVNCFCEGTKIATPDGETTVENLRKGDMLRLADGTETPVTWVGHQTINTQRTHPRFVNPVCIKAGALDVNVPSRDLFVSGDHAIGIDGCLINAITLVNGRSIYQVRNVTQESFTYYHVETEKHALLLAENTPSESFIDYRSPFVFDNADEREDRSVEEMPLPRISSKRLLPEHISKRIVDRAKTSITLRPTG